MPPTKCWCASLAPKQLTCLGGALYQKKNVKLILGFCWLILESSGALASSSCDFMMILMRDQNICARHCKSRIWCLNRAASRHLSIVLYAVFCEEEDKTFAHLTNECPCFISFRHDISILIQIRKNRGPFFQKCPLHSGL